MISSLAVERDILRLDCNWRREKLFARMMGLAERAKWKKRAICFQTVWKGVI